MRTRWFARFLDHTFHGKALMTEEVLRALAADMAHTRACLAEVLQEITLTMQALDMIDLRLHHMQDRPEVMPVASVPPVVLSSQARQRP